MAKIKDLATMAEPPQSEQPQEPVNHLPPKLKSSEGLRCEKEIDAIRKRLGIKSSELLIDEQKETAYDKLWAILSKIETEQGPHKTRELLLNLVNSGLSETGRNPLNIGLLKEVDLKTAKSESASKIAGREISRPIFVFRSNEAFKKFYAALTGSTNIQGHSDITTRGFVTDLDIEIENGQKVRIKLIVVAPDNEHIGHEIRHTIDPHLGQREGYNGILEEVFACYWESVVEGRYPEGSDKLWDDLRASIWGGKGKGSYYAHYSEQAAEKMTFEEYGNLTGRIVDAVKNLHRKYGDHIKTQRAIAQSKTLDELFSLAT